MKQLYSRVERGHGNGSAGGTGSHPLPTCCPSLAPPTPTPTRGPTEEPPAGRVNRPTTLKHFTHARPSNSTARHACPREKEGSVHREACRRMSALVLFLIAPNWKQPCVRQQEMSAQNRWWDIQAPVTGNAHPRTTQRNPTGTVANTTPNTREHTSRDVREQLEGTSRNQNRG